MQNWRSIYLIVSMLTTTLVAQRTHWGAEISYFFDNTEFEKSSFVVDQTMTGIHLVPTLGINMDSTQRLITGANVLILAGAAKPFEAIFPLAYYSLIKTNQQLLIGSFPRAISLAHYSSFLFADSIRYFRPTVQGIFWNLGTKQNYVNFWLDWTGKQTTSNRETFFVGISSHVQFKNNFFVDFQSYLHHFANTNPPLAGSFLYDNAQMILKAGYQNNLFNNKAQFMLSGGLFLGYERERGGANKANLPIGIVSGLKIDTRHLGLESNLYSGDARFLYYSTQGNRLYWGNAFLRDKLYIENKLYLRLLNNRYVQGKISYQLHVSQGKLMHQQVFTLQASVDNILKKNKN